MLVPTANYPIFSAVQIVLVLLPDLVQLVRLQHPVRNIRVLPGHERVANIN